MKRFNLVVLLLWIGIFACSLHNTPSYPDGMENETGLDYVISSTIYKFNNVVQNNCYVCARPDQKVSVEVGMNEGQMQYAEQDEYASLTDTRMTVTILRNTAPLLLFFMLAINIAFYSAKGTFGYWANTLARVGRVKWHKITGPARKLLADRRRRKMGVTLRPDQA